MNSQATLGDAVEAFILEHEYCGEQDAGIEGEPRLDDVHVRGGDQPERGR